MLKTIALTAAVALIALPAAAGGKNWTTDSVSATTSSSTTKNAGKSGTSFTTTTTTEVIQGGANRPRFCFAPRIARRVVASGRTGCRDAPTA